jgi:hypothetical protein
MIAMDDDTHAPSELGCESVPCAYDLAAAARRPSEAACAFDVSDGVPRPTTPSLPSIPELPRSIVPTTAVSVAAPDLPLPLPGQVIELLPATRRTVRLRIGNRTITIEQSGHQIYLDLHGATPLCLSTAEVRRLCAALERKPL